MRGELSRRDVIASASAGLGALTFGTGSAGAADRVEYNVGVESPRAEQAARNAAEQVERVLDWGGGEKTITATYPEKAIENLRRRRGVRYVEENGTMHAIDAELDDAWGVDRVDADVAHANGETGGDGSDGEGGADIAIIDTGIDSDHPDLQANVGAGAAFVECKGSPKDCHNAWDDDEGHGTHCAGIAAAVDDGSGVVGVSPGATLHAVKVLDKQGSGTFSDIAAGIEYVADQGWDVANMSLGASSGSQTVKDACAYAQDNGVLLVAASGNDGPCNGCVGYPAAYSEVIAVTASTEDDQIANFSSIGSEVELTAPGKGVYSTYLGGGYETLSGTSMASPHVAGAGAQLMDNGYTSADARDRLTSTAETLRSSDTRDDKQGHGLVDVAASLGLVTRDDYNVDVRTRDASPGSTSATLNGYLREVYDNIETSVGFQYRETGASTWTRSENTVKMSSTGSYSVDVSGLSQGTEYEYRAVAENPHDDDQALDMVDTYDGPKTFTTTTSTESAPAVDSLSASEVETGDDDAEFDVSWSVSDADGNLSSVDLALTQDSDGSAEDSASVSVSGGSASGTTRLVAAGDDGSGNSYTVELTVTDDTGKTATATASATESENAAPSVDSFSVQNASNGGWARANVTWAVSDDRDLSSVALTMEQDGATVDSTTASVSGTSASGETRLEEKKGSGTYTVTITVTDAAGKTASDSADIVA